MKRKLFIIIAVIIISACTSLIFSLGGLVFFTSKPSVNFTSSKSVPRKANPNKVKPINNTDLYNIKAVITIKDHTVDVKEEILLKNTTKNTCIYLPSANISVTKVTSVKSDMGTTGITRHDTMLFIKSRQEASKISIEYEIQLKENNNTLSYSGSTVYLTNFLAVPAVYKDGSPILTYKSSFGDPYIYDITNYYIIFNINRSFSVIAPGSRSENTSGAKKSIVFKADNLRDFPAVIYNQSDLKEVSHGGVNFYFLNSSATVKDIEYAFDYAEKNIGPYPYKDFFIVRMPLFHEGMEFSNMIFLSDTCFKNADLMKRVAFHEVFHQWFYGVIGTDQLNEPFLDEGLVEYLSSLLCKSIPSGAVEDKFTSTPLNAYTSRDQYYRMAYYDSSLYFYNLHQDLGNNFFKVLQSFYKEYKFKIAYFNDFQKCVSEFSSKK